MDSPTIYTIAGRTIRHWTIDSREFVGGSQRAAPAQPYSESADGGQVQLLASKLARLKADPARRLN